MDRVLTTLLEYIEAHPTATPADMAHYFGVSTRTIYNRIVRINADEHIGVAIHRHNNVFKVESTSTDPVLDTPQIASADERIAYLLNDLLMRNDWITIDKLASIMHCSRASISRDLVHAGGVLETYNLSLARRPRYGIRIEGTELNKRICLAALGARPNQKSGVEDLFSDDLTQLSHVVTTVLDAYGFIVQGLLYQNLLVHLAVALSRIKAHCFMPVNSQYMDRIKDSHEFEIAHHIAEAIHDTYALELPQEEIAYIALHLAGKQTLDEADQENSLVITDEVWDLVSCVIERIDALYHFNFAADLELRMNLARHVGPLAVRLKYHMKVENPLLTDTKNRFPLAYSMAKEAASVLSEHYGVAPSEDEVGYLAFSFALALERQKGQLARKNILIVCASGQGSARLLEHHYRKQFGDMLGTITTCDALRIDQVDLTTIDYVFTTVPLKTTLSRPVYEVNYFLDAADVGELAQVLAGGDRSYEACYRADLFFSHQQAATQEEALRQLCEAVSQKIDLPENFYDLVLERERLAPTAFGNAVALPHPLEPVSDRTFVAVSLFDEPVEWMDRTVRAIFLISVARERDVDLEAFYHALLRVVMDSHAVETLLAHQSLECLFELMASMNE